jgi:hypothetical protein
MRRLTIERRHRVFRTLFAPRHGVLLVATATAAGPASTRHSADSRGAYTTGGTRTIDRATRSRGMNTRPATWNPPHCPRAQPRITRMRRRTTGLLAVAAVAAAACTRYIPSPPSPSTTAATATSAPTSQPTPTAGLQSGPHSPLANVDLPAGTVFVGNSSDEEAWRYSAPYDETVAFLGKQFATGRKYDTHGATWWRDLPPCYNDKYDWSIAAPHHESPPGGWVMDDSTLWLWTDASISLSVEVFRPSSTAAPNEIVIDYRRWDHSHVCNRQ